MKKLIKEFKEGDKGCELLLATSVNKGVNGKGNPYLSVTLQDKSGNIDGKYWDIPADKIDLYRAGMMLEVTYSVLSYQKQLQLRIHELNIVENPDVDFRDYVKSSKLSEEELKESVQSKIEKIENENILILIKEVMKRYETKFYNYPAASKNHHDFIGGLATHTLGMLETGEHLCEIYPLLNKDLLFGGIILHDIGKTIELSGAISTEYTLEGKLLGHISIMQAELTAIAEELQIEGEEVLLLRHMILSHHGAYEYGSPVLPMIPEAEILYLIDNIDARMQSMEKALENVEKGEFSQRIYALEGRKFYKNKL